MFGIRKHHISYGVLLILLLMLYVGWPVGFFLLGIKTPWLVLAALPLAIIDVIIGY